MAPEKVPEEKVYPAPLASHEEVVRCPALFVDTLRRFHALLGTRFMIPVIGGKELDLHLLYSEVTKRGGLEKVVGERRWKEVIAAFNFPPTTTSASFVLRKYYISLLHHFEKVHFFRLQGPLVAPAVTTPVRSNSTCRGLPSPEEAPAPEQAAPFARKRRADFTGGAGAGIQVGAAVNFPVVGMIDGKFDHGYLVTVRLGSEVLRGVLFHHVPPANPVPLVVSENAIVPYTGVGSPVRMRRRRRRRRRDPAHPKPNRSAYNFFFAEKHSKLKVLYPQREREFSKMIGESWNKLTQEERMVYQDSGLKDKERYKRELQEYKERLKLVQVQTMEEDVRAVPSSQVDAKSETTTSDT